MNRRTALQALGALALGYVTLRGRHRFGAYSDDWVFADLESGGVPPADAPSREHVLISVVTWWKDDLDLRGEVERALTAITEKNPGWSTVPEPMEVRVEFGPSTLRAVGPDGSEKWSTLASEPESREVWQFSQLDQVARELRDEHWFEPYHKSGVTLTPTEPTQVRVTFKLHPSFGAPEFEGVGLVRYAVNNTVEDLSQQLQADLHGPRDWHDDVVMGRYAVRG